MAAKNPAAAQDPVQHSLDVLWTMVAAVLVQSGKVFREPAKHDGKNVLHTNAQMKQVIPGALGRFHSALDVLEIEILRAKSTMTRDLAVARARRVEREREAAIQGNRTGEPSSAQGLDGASDVKAASVASNGQTSVQSSSAPKGAATNAPSTVNAKAKSPTKGITSPTTSMKPTASVPAPASQSTPSAEPKPQAVHAKSTPTTVAAAASTKKTPTASLADDTMDFDLDFSTDPALVDDNLQPKAGADPTNNGAGSVGHVGGGGDDMAALLPGLESYANASNDEMDLTGASGAPAASAGTANGELPATSAPESMSFDLNDSVSMVPAESTNFDDLFFNSNGLDLEGGGGGTADGGDGHVGDDNVEMMDFGTGAGGEGGEFDDALFGL